tara:strand:- start:50 stop:547 length:498 start_codon:yes stop_codon:yes gene_type:complete
MSVYREAVLEHLFVGELLRYLWVSGPVRAEVMKPRVDDAGYDVVIESNRVLRHIQLKASFHGAKTARQKVNRELANKPSGCIVWILFDTKTMNLGPFLYFGSEPGEPLPTLESFPVARHSKGNAKGHKAKRPGIHVVPKAKFRELQTIEELAATLFGPIPVDRLN